MFKIMVAAFVGLSLSTLASAQSLIEGEHYEVLDEAVPTQVEDDQIEVIEAFWYGCPHCYNLEGPLNAWVAEQPDDVTFLRLPATMGGDWNKHATAFYAAKELGILEDVHDDFFDAIHQEDRSLTETGDIADFFSNYGVSKDEAREALNSFGVKSQVNQAHAQMRAFKLMGVPALVVEGRYVITPSSAGSLENMPQIADALVEQVRDDRNP